MQVGEGWRVGRNALDQGALVFQVTAEGGVGGKCEWLEKLENGSAKV